MLFRQNEPRRDQADGHCMVARFGRTNPSMPTSGVWQNEPESFQQKDVPAVFPLYFQRQ
jgi:hypothetical protein